jgi:ribonuclease P protein component
MPLDSIRLPSPGSYAELSRKGRRVRHACGEIELRILAPAPDGQHRMAVRLKRKNGDAPFRNRVRRQLRELLRATRTDMAPAWILWSFPSSRLTRRPRELKDDARSCLLQAGALPS